MNGNGSHMNLMAGHYLTNLERRQRRCHQNQILKQMPITFEKIDNLHMNHQLSHHLKLTKQFQPLMTNNLQKGLTDISIKFNKNGQKEKLFIDRNNQNYAYDGNSLNRSGKKLLPNLQKSIEKKLQEIIFISNHGNHQKLNQGEVGVEGDQKLIGRRVHLNYDGDRIVRQYWQTMQKQNKMSKVSLERIKQRKLQTLLRKHIDDMDEDEGTTQFMNITQKLPPKLPKIGESYSFHTKTRSKFNNSSLFSCINRQNLASVLYSNARSNLKKQQQYKEEDNAQRQLLQQQVMNYLKGEQEKKQCALSIDNNFLQRENAHKIYSIIKGGYTLDPTDVDGQYISLKKFGQEKESFEILNELYKKVKRNNNIPKFTQQNIYDQSFRSLVCISELKGKLAPNQLANLMKINKIVK